MPFHNTWSLSLRFDVRPSVSHSEWIWDYVKSFSLVPSITMIVHFWKVRSVCSKEGEWQAGWKSWCNEDKRMGPHMPILHGRVHWSVWDVHSDHRGLWQDSSSLQLHLVILHPSTVIGWILTSVHFETGEESEKIGKKKKGSFVMLLFGIINLGDHSFPLRRPGPESWSLSWRHEFVHLSVLSRGPEIVCSIFWMVRPKHGHWSKTKHAGPAMAVFHPGLGLPENSKTLTCCYCQMEKMMCSMISDIITFLMAYVSYYWNKSPDTSYHL